MCGTCIHLDLFAGTCEMSVDLDLICFYIFTGELANSMRTLSMPKKTNFRWKKLVHVGRECKTTPRSSSKISIICLSQGSDFSRNKHIEGLAFTSLCLLLGTDCIACRIPTGTGRSRVYHRHACTALLISIYLYMYVHWTFVPYR